jgi:ribulose kinase
MNTDESYVIGVDYGTDSVRSVIVNAHNGTELAASVFITHVGKMACFAMLPKTSFASTRSIILKAWSKPSSVASCRRVRR